MGKGTDKLKDRNKTHNIVYDSELILRGLLKCPVCGASMTVSRLTRKRNDGTKEANE